LISSSDLRSTVLHLIRARLCNSSWPGAPVWLSRAGGGEALTRFSKARLQLLRKSELISKRGAQWLNVWEIWARVPSAVGFLGFGFCFGCTLALAGTFL